MTEAAVADPSSHTTSPCLRVEARRLEQEKRDKVRRILAGNASGRDELREFILMLGLRLEEDEDAISEAVDRLVPERPLALADDRSFHQRRRQTSLASKLRIELGDEL
jgi:hypothetical protein